MSDDFYPFVDSGDPAPDNAHLTGRVDNAEGDIARSEHADAPDGATAQVSYATRIAIYDDMFSTPRVIVIAPQDVRTYLEEITNTVYRCMKEQGGGISLMVIREIVENFIHANFVEPIISILDDGNTIRFADQGPGIDDKERAFEFGVTSADRNQKRYIRGTGAGFPMVQQYLEHAGGAVSIEDNLHQGTVVTVSIDPARVAEIERAGARGGAVRGAHEQATIPTGAAMPATGAAPSAPTQPGAPYAAQMAPAGTPEYGTQMPGPGAGPDMGYAAAAGMGAYGMQAPAAAPQQAGVYAPYPQQGWPWASQQPAAWQNPSGWPAYQINPWGQAPGAPWGGQGQAQAYPPLAQSQPVPATEPFVSERGALAIRFLVEHGSCGPTDLAGAFGSSAPTWSRELEGLGQAGLVIKRGQKRFLTDAGRAWAQAHLS